jgi:hypothetical protein
MANDAKFGLISGLVAVLLVAVAYYQKPVDPGTSTPPTTLTPTKPLVAPINGTQPAQAIPQPLPTVGIRLPVSQP